MFERLFKITLVRTFKVSFKLLFTVITSFLVTLPSKTLDTSYLGKKQLNSTSFIFLDI